MLKFLAFTRRLTASGHCYEPKTAEGFPLRPPLRAPSPKGEFLPETFPGDKQIHVAMYVVYPISPFPLYIPIFIKVLSFLFILHKTKKK
jgi:hypothetical protein